VVLASRQQEHLRAARTVVAVSVTCTDHYEIHGLTIDVPVPISCYAEPIVLLSVLCQMQYTLLHRFHCNPVGLVWGVGCGTG